MAELDNSPVQGPRNPADIYEENVVFIDVNAFEQREHLVITLEARNRALRMWLAFTVILSAVVIAGMAWWLR